MGSNHSEQRKKQEKDPPQAGSLTSSTQSRGEAHRKANTEEGCHQAAIAPDTPHLFTFSPDLDQSPLWPLQPERSPDDSGTESVSPELVCPTHVLAPFPPPLQLAPGSLTNSSENLNTSSGAPSNGNRGASTPSHTPPAAPWQAQGSPRSEQSALRPTEAEVAPQSRDGSNASTMDGSNGADSSPPDLKVPLDFNLTETTLAQIESRIEFLKMQESMPSPPEAQRKAALRLAARGASHLLATKPSRPAKSNNTPLVPEEPVSGTRPPCRHPLSPAKKQTQARTKAPRRRPKLRGQQSRQAVPKTSANRGSQAPETKAEDSTEPTAVMSSVQEEVGLNMQNNTPSHMAASPKVPLLAPPKVWGNHVTTGDTSVNPAPPPAPVQITVNVQSSAKPADPGYGEQEKKKEGVFFGSPPTPLHPEGRWLPFSIDRSCRQQCRKGQLPRNVEQWFSVRRNYLCEPPWVTTATLLASLALRVRPEGP